MHVCTHRWRRQRITQRSTVTWMCCCSCLGCSMFSSWWVVIDSIFPAFLLSFLFSIFPLFCSRLLFNPPSFFPALFFRSLFLSLYSTLISGLLFPLVSSIFLCSLHFSLLLHSCFAPNLCSIFLYSLSAPLEY
jgi:hypothetical protein